MKVNKRYLGRIVEVLLWDHNTKGSDDVPTKCRVVGRVVKTDKLNLCLEYWNCETNPEHNNERHNILQSTIIEVVVYEPLRIRVK